MPERVQLSRRKGWRMPENTVKVDRSTRWGNPFVGDAKLTAEARAYCVGLFREWINRVENLGFRKRVKRDLRDKNLACWCPLDQSCHADVLLELANADHSSDARNMVEGEE